MYRSKILKKKTTGTSASTSFGQSSQALPSQNRSKTPEKENQEILGSQETNTIQNPTQFRNRFLSQRAALLNQTQQQHNKGKGPLEIILYSCGLEVSEIGCELQKEGDPISFTRRLRVLLTSKPDYPQNTQQYLDEFKRNFVLTNEEKFSKCEKYMRGIFMGDGSKQHQTQTSLIMCLLAINCFKDEMVKILLEGLKDYVTTAGDKAEPQHIGLVLTQFKFSDQILSDEVYNFMFEEFFKILAKCKTFECQQVIVHHFTELEITKQEEAARRLILMFENKKKELLRFLDIFCLMAMDQGTINEVFETIQRHIERECSKDQYLSMIKYSIHYSQTVEEIVDILRDQVNWEKCDKSVIKEIFKIIGKSLIRDGNKTIAAWTKIISDINNSERLKHIDFIMLLLIADTNTETQLNSVKKIVLDKILKGLFTDAYLKKSFAIFSPIVPSQTLLELLDGLQKAKDNQIYNFLATCYKLMFRIGGESKAIIGSLTNFLCEKRSNLPFTSGSDFKMTILTILTEVMHDSQRSAAELVYNHKILLRALNISRVELNVSEHRALMKLLSCLVYNVEYSRGFKQTELRTLNEIKDTLGEHLNMVNIKYIQNPEPKIRRLGIIGAVKVVSSKVFDVLEETSIAPDEDIQIEDIPEGPIRDAAKLVDLIFAALDENYEMMSMFFDEMSLELNQMSNDKRSISQIFINWFNEKLFNRLITIVQSTVDDETIEEFDLIDRFATFDDSFEYPEIPVPLGMLLMSGKMKIVVLPSLFKLTLLTRLFRYGRDYASLSGLLAMSICLPKTFATSEDELNEDKEKAKRQLDLYFHCCNWIRELISGFIKSTDQTFLNLIKGRLKQLIEIEKHLNRLIKKMPSGYLPPLINDAMRKSFEALTKEKIVTRAPKERKKEVSSVKPVDIKSNLFCRDMDNEIVLFLKAHFLLNTTITDDEQFTLTELNYILEDVHKKFQVYFKPKNFEQKTFVNEMLAIQHVGTSVLPHLARIFVELNEQIVNAMEIDGDEQKSICKSFSVILEMFNMTFVNKKLKSDDKILLQLLKTLLLTDATNMKTPDSVCKAIIENYSKFAENAQDMDGAIALVEFIDVIASHTSNPNKFKPKIIETTETYLRKEWQEFPSNANAIVEKLISIYVQKASNVDELAEHLNEIEKFIKDGTNDFPCINKSNFICIIRAYLKRSSEIVTTSKSNQMNFEFWETFAKIQCKFVDAIKQKKSPVALNLFLKNFVTFLKRFNTDGISVLKVMARNDQAKCVELLKSIQRIRRSAHGTVCELKHRKNQTVSKILPKIREQFEIFRQETSSVIASEEIPMFTEGPLRNFDLNSVDIFSQNTTQRSTTDSEDGDSDGGSVENNANISADQDTSSDDDDNDNNRQENERGRSRSTVL